VNETGNAAKSGTADESKISYTVVQDAMTVFIL
jgi:hypothetical protein